MMTLHDAVYVVAGQGGAAGMNTVMLPTTLSMATVPVVSTLPISTQTHLHLQAPPGGM